MVEKFKPKTSDEIWDDYVEDIRNHEKFTAKEGINEYMHEKVGDTVYDVDVVLRYLFSAIDFPEPAGGIDYKMGTFGFLMMIPAKIEYLTSSEKLLGCLRDHVTGPKGEPAQFSIWEKRFANMVVEVFTRLENAKKA